MLTICCCPIAVLAIIVGCCRALLSLLPEHWLSPDVGPVLGCRGMLNFVLMPPQYGFELVRGPNDLQAHQERYLLPVASLSTWSAEASRS